MKTNYKPFARKFRQFKNQAKQIKRLNVQGKFERMSKQRQHEMLIRLKRLYTDLRGKLQHWRLRKTLTGLSFLFLSMGNINQANAQSFATPQLNPYGIAPSPGYNFVATADIDNDGDTDLFLFGYTDAGGSIDFLENSGTAAAPNFEAAVSAPFNIQVPADIISGTFSDIDNDGDLDLFVGKYADFDGGLYFYENTGTASAPNFEAPQLNPFGVQSTVELMTPAFVDIDGDGDQDLFVGEYGAGTGPIKYFENTGTAESAAFGAPADPPFGITDIQTGYLTFMSFGDIDNDGDMDLMAGTSYDEYSYEATFYFAKNTGTATTPNFDAYVENPYGLISFETEFSQPVFADIDGDGDLDLFSSAEEDGVVLFENTSPVSTKDNVLSADLVISPNPTDDLINLSLESVEILNEVSISIIDTKGRLLSQKTVNVSGNTWQQQFDVSQFSTGAYFIQINAEGKTVSKSFIKE